ncbi:CDP-glycerol glycerophosphotransferase family protein [Virgibacillus dakarensis]|uniref:CDP-glycerol glycerophosphotransferase family protein n=1 Tax=Virgibacillus dakarensis TaxID=1917889 RepID=UPI000B43B0E8|nr:CDP-glycerol glycerophosphotransferase family protein [Virgibacillus dakarensis]
MARELVVTVYLFVFQILFNGFKLFPQKKKAIFVASFGDNILYTLNELKKHTNYPVVILKTSQCKVDFEHDDNVLNFESMNLLQWIQAIYHLATADKVFVDNYFGFLAVTDFKPNVQCVQLWHAAGAIKRFGLKDPSVENRSERALERFKSVYQRFTHVVVGSEKMAAIFRQSFGLANEAILRSGIPRSDFFFNIQEKKNVEQELRQIYPVTNRKKVILYAPTYRDDQLNKAEIALEIEKLYEKFHDDYVLFLRLHPAVKHEFRNQHSDFVYDVSDVTDINHLLVITDILITDYSSIPFEFSLLERPMIFFAYDLDKYERTTGFWEDYETLVPGPVVDNTDDLIDVIENGYFDIERIKDFANLWNQYSKGNASKTLINKLYREEEQYQAVEN